MCFFVCIEVAMPTSFVTFEIYEHLSLDLELEDVGRDF